MIARARRDRDARSTGRPTDDSGAVLVLVLLLIVVAGLMVIPLMSYATSVLQLNTAVSERSKDVEAAKGGLRLTLNDATASDVFVICDTDGGGSGDLGSVTVNDTTVTTTCAELEEVGPLDALGFQVPVGAVATQLGAATPPNAIGGTAQSAAVPPYPDGSLCSGSTWSGCWWASMLPLPPDELWSATDGDIWMPELPRLPSTVRTDDEPAPYYSYSSAFDTSTGVQCRVFFPGRYEQPLTLDGDSYYYFASGVYYFTQPITITGNADVVVGMGIEDFEARPIPERSYCADDLQLAAEFTEPIQKAIDGGGATWVFGDEARLVVDDSTGSPSIRFNQRYSEQDRGGRISIMTVNGVDAGSAVVAHDVPDVNYVRPSLELDYDDLNDVFDLNPIVPSQYRPSDPRFTDAARLPGAPTLSVIGHKHRRLSDGSDRGAVLAVWDEMVDNAAGGALIDEFEVEMRREDPASVWTSWNPVCLGDGDIVHLSGTGPGGADQHACYIAEQRLGHKYEVRVRARNVVGWGPRSTDGDRTPGSGGGNDAVPDAPTGVTVDETDVDDVARVSWTPSASPDDVTITGYRVTMERLDAGSAPDYPPVTWNGDQIEVQVVGTAPVVSRVPTVDPNGAPLAPSHDGPLIVFFDTTLLPPGWFIETDPFDTGTDIEIRVGPPSSGAPTDEDDEISFDLPYTVFDAANSFASNTLRIEWLSEFDDDDKGDKPDAKTFDAYPEAGRAWVAELPIIDPQARPVSVIDLDTSNFDLNEWTFDLTPTATGTELTITTTATAPSPGTFIPLNYTVEAGGATDTAQIRVFVPVPSSENRGSCTVKATPWFDTELRCEISVLTDLTDPSDDGYRARVEAITPIGSSPVGLSAAPFPMSFDGGGTAAPLPPVRVVDPWTPEAIIDVRNADSANAVHVHIAGYVAAPMGRIRVDNPESDENDTVEIVGGVLAGTFELNDDDDDTLIGFFNDIVLQRKIRIVTTAGGITSTAVVQINEDASYRINSWVVN